MKDCTKTTLICLLIAIHLFISRIFLPEEATGKIRNSTPPSITLIVVDTLRADQLVSDNQNGMTVSPFKSLVEKSVIFTNAYTHAPWTRPAVASLLTSLYPSSHGVIRGSKMEGGPDVLSEKLFTLPEYLQKKGYYTVGFVANPQISADFGFSQGFDEYYCLDKTSSDNFLFRRIQRTFNIYLKNSVYANAEALSERVYAWLAGNRKAPFFLYIHYMDPHRPYFCQPEKWWSRTESAYDQMMTVDKKEDYLDCYRREVAFVGQSIGALIQRMQEMGIFESSVIILTSDHGEEFLEHGSWDHGHTLYEEQLRVPLVIKLPYMQMGRIDNRVTRLIDVFPTVLEIAGLDIPRGLQGEAVVSATGKPLTGNKDVFSERLPPGKGDKALLSGDWKLILSNGKDTKSPRVELYNIKDDPGETKDLSRAKDSLVQKFRLKLEDISRFALKHAVKSEKKTISESVRKRLKALGYIK